MFSFLKKQKKNGLNYDTKLIKKFHKDHEKLVKLITKISKAIEEENSKKTKALLAQLKLEILGHFMEEDIKLYRYLKKYYADNEDTKITIKMFEESIKTIQRDVIDFLDYYIKEHNPLDKAFKEKFYNIVDAFGTRIKTEESNLYTLYLP